MTELNRLMRYKREIKQYLRELGELCMEPPSEGALLSMDLTEKIRSEASQLKAKPKRTFTVDFCEKGRPRFMAYVAKLEQANSSPIYVWTDRSNSCGVFQIPSLSKFNFNFPFDVNDQGIVVLLASDLEDRLLLDFSRRPDSSGDDLEIEVSGDHWTNIDY